MNLPDRADRSQVADRLHSAAIHLLRGLRRVDLQAGTTSARLSVLSVLVFGGDRGLSALAVTEQVALPTMSRMVKQMEAAGLVRRSPSPDDSRAVLVAASPSGRELLLAARERRLERLEGLLDDLDDEDVALLGEAARLIESIAAKPSTTDG